MPISRRHGMAPREATPWVSHRRTVVDVDEIDAQSIAEAKSLRSGPKPSLPNLACAKTRSSRRQTQNHVNPTSYASRSEKSFTRRSPPRNEMRATAAAEFFLNIRDRSAQELSVQNSEITQPDPTKISQLAQGVAISSVSQKKACALVDRLDYGGYTVSIDSEPENTKDEVVEAKWVYSDPSLQDRVAGEITVHEGRRGRWLASSDPGYSNVRDWVFAPEEPLQFKRSQQKQKKRRTKTQTSFLSLPGELRNKIYARAIPECRVLITATKPNKDLAKLKSMWSEEKVQHKRKCTKLFHTLDNNNIDQGFELTIALLSTCRKVRDDVEQYLYSRTTFCFDSTKVLNRFLSTASNPGLRAIRKVEIFHQGYSNPENTKERIFRDRYYAKWLQVCTRFGNELSSLEELKLEAVLRKWPCEFAALNDSNDICRKAFLQLTPRRLRKVEVKLQHPMIKNNRNVLTDLAHALEDDMMTEEGREARDRWEHKKVVQAVRAKKQAEREAKAMAKRKELLALQPLKSLNITKEDIANQNPVPSKALSKGLEKYQSIDTKSMWPAELDYFKSQYCSEKHKN